MWHATHEGAWLGVVRERDSAMTCGQHTGVIYELLLFAKTKMPSNLIKIWTLRRMGKHMFGSSFKCSLTNCPFSFQASCLFQI